MLFEITFKTICKETIMSKSHEVKQKIIQSTKSLLKQNGQITIKDIADACYINIAAVNYHFGSKDALLTIVIEDIIEEIQTLTKKTLETLPNTTPPEEILKIMIDTIYTFTTENIGIIKHLFLNEKTQDKHATHLINAFFTQSSFKEIILNHLSESTHINDKETLEAKYMLLFSSFTLPFFLQIVTDNDPQQINTLKQSSFREKYIKELLKIIQ